MQLSIVIVNQDLCRPLRQALTALKRAVQHLDAQITVIDNASADRSVEMVRTEFADVILLTSDKEEGFSELANRAIQKTNSSYVLIVHPGMITGEDTLDKILDFMDAHPHTGGLSVRALDAEGHFIEGSKKAMPPEWVTFFRYTGLSRIFSKSRLFSPHYEAGWVEEFENTETDVLNSGFMLLRRSALNEVGLFDERFPVYGHDIDLSYRMRLAGYNNYYFAKTFIIQQAVAPVPAFSFRYLKNFYGAMLTFAAKYLFRMPELRLKAMPGVPAAAAYGIKQ